MFLSIMQLFLNFMQLFKLVRPCKVYFVLCVTRPHSKNTCAFDQFIDDLAVFSKLLRNVDKWKY